MVLKIIYTVFLALIIALFVGLGIDAFYPSPKAPEYPVVLQSYKEMCEATPEQKAAQAKFDQEQRDYIEAMKPYNRNVSMISLSAAIIVLILSLTLLAKIKMIADGILLGGVFTTIYSIIRGLMTDNTKFRFSIVVVGLIIALVLGYIKFIRQKAEAA